MKGISLPSGSFGDTGSHRYAACAGEWAVCCDQACSSDYPSSDCITLLPVTITEHSASTLSQLCTSPYLPLGSHAPSENMIEGDQWGDCFFNLWPSAQLLRLFQGLASVTRMSWAPRLAIVGRSLDIQLRSMWAFPYPTSPPETFSGLPLLSWKGPHSWGQHFKQLCSGL